MLAWPLARLRPLAFAAEPAVDEACPREEESEKEQVERVLSELRLISEREREARQAQDQGGHHDDRSGEILWIAATSLIVGSALGALFSLRGRRGRGSSAIRNPFSSAQREHEKALAQIRLKRTRAHLDLHLKLFPNTPRHALPSIEALVADAGQDSGSARHHSLQFEGITELALPAFFAATAIVGSAAALIATGLRYSHGIETWADFSEWLKNLTPQVLTPSDTGSPRLVEGEDAAAEEESHVNESRP